jgi:hypothetical protein
MTENSSEKYSSIPLPLMDSSSLKARAPLSIPIEKLPVPSEKISESPIIPGFISPQETQKLVDLEKEFERLDNAGSVPTVSVANDIAGLSGKQAGYSLDGQRFAPGSVRMNLDPIGITETGHPVYPWISGEKGKELRDEGVLMKQPEWHKKMAKKNKKIRTKNAI